MDDRGNFFTPRTFQMSLTLAVLLAIGQTQKQAVGPNIEFLAGRFLMYEGASNLSLNQVHEMFKIMNTLSKSGVDGQRALLMLPSSASASVFTEQCYLRWKAVAKYPEMGSRIIWRYHKNSHQFKLQREPLKSEVLDALDGRGKNVFCSELLKLLEKSRT